LATPLAYDKQNGGDPAKLQVGVPTIMTVTELMQGSQWTMGENFQCFRLHKEPGTLEP